MRRSSGGLVVGPLRNLSPSSFSSEEWSFHLAWCGMVYSEGCLLVVVDDGCIQVTGVARIFREEPSVCGLVMDLLVMQALTLCRALVW